MDQHPIQGGVEIIPVASCYRNPDKLRPVGPLGSNADFRGWREIFCNKDIQKLTGHLARRQTCFLKKPQYVPHQPSSLLVPDWSNFCGIQQAMSCPRGLGTTEGQWTGCKQKYQSFPAIHTVDLCPCGTTQCLVLARECKKPVALMTNRERFRELMSLVLMSRWYQLSLFADEAL